VRSLVEQWIRARHASIELDLGHYPIPDYEPLAFWGATAKLADTLSRRESGKSR
jgi:dTDP-6-deoxy-L-talose 4-dehydrogenase (NAD+)